MAAKAAIITIPTTTTLKPVTRNKSKNNNNQNLKKKLKIFNDGYLGSHTDEERSEMRYAVRIAERESSDL